MEELLWKLSEGGHNGQPVKFSYASKVHLKDTEELSAKFPSRVPAKRKLPRRVSLYDDEADYNDKGNEVNDEEDSNDH